jgi:hypothetical protein
MTDGDILGIPFNAASRKLVAIFTCFPYRTAAFILQVKLGFVDIEIRQRLESALRLYVSPICCANLP